VKLSEIFFAVGKIELGPTWVQNSGQLAPFSSLSSGRATESTRFMERAMGIEPKSEAWERLFEACDKTQGENGRQKVPSSCCVSHPTELNGQTFGTIPSPAPFPLHNPVILRGRSASSNAWHTGVNQKPELSCITNSADAWFCRCGRACPKTSSIGFGEALTDRRPRQSSVGTANQGGVLRTATRGRLPNFPN